VSHIFICWSGDRSQKLGSALRKHLPRFIPGLLDDAQASSLFFSENIAKGSRWFTAVERELDNADAGIVCVTREALQSGWLHFEAGALARAIRKNEVGGGTGGLYTYLLGVRPEELKGPLAEFQSTTFDREDTRKFCEAIVGSMGQSAPAREVWEQAFEKSWPTFELTVQAIGAMPASELIPGLEEMFRRKTFYEPLEECTRQAWIDRFSGVQQTIASLKAYRAVMTADNSYLLDLYNQLVSELDIYAMNMGALLLSESKFALDPNEGKLQIGEGVKRACEGRRGRINSVLTHLLSTNCAPVLEAESRHYAKMTSFSAKKAILIHPMEHEIQTRSAEGKPARVTDEALLACASSLWEFDRIYFYLVQEWSDSAQVDQLADCLDQEFENVRAVDGGASLIPLHYAIRALKKTIRRMPPRPDGGRERERIYRRLKSIVTFLHEHGLDKGNQVKENVDEFLMLLERPEIDGAALPG
jgi:hypothetical protein